MGLPKKISQLPLNNNLQPEDLLVTVNQNDVTTKIRLNQILSFITGSTNTYVTGGTYNDITKNIDFDGNAGFPPFSVNLSGISTSDTFVTGATLNGFTLEIDRNNGEPQITVDLSSLTGATDTNTFVSGSTLVGTNYTLERTDGVDITTDFNPIVSGKVNTDIFNTYTADTQTEINSKLDITTFDSYTANTVDNNTFITGTTLVGTNYTINENNGSSFTTDFNPIVSGKLDITTFDTYTANTTDNVVTGATLNGTTLEIERNNGLSNVTVDLSSLTGATDTNTFVTGTTLVGDSYTLKRNDGVDIITDLNPIVSGKVNTSLFDVYTASTETEINSKLDITTFNSYSAITEMKIDTKLDISTFDTYTANTTDNVVTGATLVGGTLELGRNNGLSDVTVNLSSLSGDTNTFVTGATLTNTTLGIERNDGIDITVDLSSIDNNVFVNSGNANAVTQQLTFTNTTGGTFNVTNATSLFSDNDINVTGGTYNPNTGCVGFTTNSGTTFDVCGFVTGLTDTFISGTTLVGTDYSLNRSDGIILTTDFNPIVSGKLDTDIFNNYTANTTDNVVTGATLNSTTLELERNNGLSNVTVDLSSLSGISENTFVTAFTYNNNNVLTIKDNENNNFSTTINELSGLTIDGELTVTNNSYLNFITGHTTYLIGENDPGGGTVASLIPTLTISDNPGSGGGAQNFAGPTLKFIDPSTGSATDGYIFYRNNGGGSNYSQSFNFISDGAFNFTASNNNGAGSDFFRITKNQARVTITENASAPRTDFKIHNANGGTAYSRLGVGASNDYWYMEADDVNTPMHIGYDDNGVDTNVLSFTKSSGTLDGSLEIMSGLTVNTLNLSDTPVLNNSGTDILVRNNGSGEVEYRELSTFSASTDINTGNVLWVDSIFGDDGTAVSNRQDLPYLTIEQALSGSSNGDTVIVRPGTYDEEELIIPEGVSLVSEGGWEVTIIGKSPATATRDILELKENSYIEGFSVNVPEGPHMGILSSNVSGTSTANNITFYGNSTTGASGTALSKISGGKLIGSNIRVEGGGMETALSVSAGVLALDGVHIPQSNGSIDNALLVTTSSPGVSTIAGKAQIVGFNCGNSNVTNALRTSFGESGAIPTALIYTPNIFNCTNAIKSEGDYEEINFLGGRIDNVTYVVNVDLTGGGTDSKYRITSNHQPDYIYPPAVVYNAEFGLDFMQESTEIFNSSKNLFGLDQMSVGTAEIGTKSHFGRGASSTVGLKVFTTDNTASSVSDGSNFIDVSDNAKSKEGSTITFQTGGTNTTILFTTQRVNSDLSTTLSYYGLNINVLQRAVGGSYIFEYWDGSQWREDSVHSVSEDLGYNYGNTLFLRNQSEENLTFDLSKDAWTGKTINGVEGYWMRCRTVTTGTTKPTFEQIKIIYDNTTISKEGILSLHGKSLYRESINLLQGNWDGSSTLDDYTSTVGSGSNSWTHRFKESELDTGESALINMVIPAGTSTSQKVNITANYITSGGDANDEISTLKLSFLPVEVSNNLIADSDGSKEPVQRTVSNTSSLTSIEPQVQTEDTVTGSNIVHSVSFGDFDISDFYEGDMALMRLEKESDGGTVNFNLVSLNLSLSKWSLGQQSEPFRLGTQTIFSEDWEDGGVSNGWSFVSAGTNVWVVSDDTSYSGTNSLYITDDAGGSKPYQYAGSTQLGTHAYVDFSIPDNAISLTVNFYWTCDGENGGGIDSYDFGTVYLTGTTGTPASTGLPPSSGRIGATDNQGKFNDGYKSAEEGNWQLETIPVASNLWTAGTDARLICSWKNDSTLQGQPPMAIDNITIDIEYNI